MVKRLIFTTLSFYTVVAAQAQLSPSVTSWFQSTTIKGRHYVSGNSTAITDAALTANVQAVTFRLFGLYYYLIFSCNLIMIPGRRIATMPGL